VTKPAHIAIEEGTQIVHPVFQHGEPVHAGAEGEEVATIAQQMIDTASIKPAAAAQFLAALRNFLTEA
jgi:hypothetical protein